MGIGVLSARGGTAIVADDTLWKTRAEQAGVVWLGPSVQQALMPALGGTPRFLADEEGEDGVVWQTFQRGPFRLGYIGFPIGGTLKGDAVGPARIARLLATAPGRRLHVLRVIGSAFKADEGLDAFTERLPETRILDLQRFDPLRNGRIRRDVAHAKKLEVHVRDAGFDQGEILYEAYTSTVMAHGNAPKYTRPYFIEFCRAAQREPGLRIYTATVRGRFAGFLAAVIEREAAHYLHSSVLKEFRRYCVTDLLMLTVIEAAREAGVRTFNSLSSPPGQPTLVRFKEKWGGVTQIQTVYEFRPRPLMAALMRVSRAAWRLYRAHRP